MRHSVRASLGSISVAECSSEALSHTTMSPTPYLKRSWYFGCVECAASSSSRSRASSSGMPTMPNELPDTAYSALRPVTGCGRAIRCVITGIFAFCSSVSSEAAVRLSSSTSLRLP